MTASISVPGKRGFQKAPQDASAIVAAAALPQPAPAPIPEPAADAGPTPFVRKPFGQHSQKTAYPARPGYHRHRFNDERTRIDDALAAGYKHVVDRDGRNVSCIVGVNEGGLPLAGVLMEIPQAWYDEDMAAQQREGPDVTDAAIRRGGVEGQVGQDGRYLPSRGISISTK